jgi:membrane dipeptidase
MREAIGVVDAHNDLLCELVERRAEANPFGRYYLEDLRAGGVRVQVCALYLFWDQVGDRALRSALEVVQAWRRAAEENPDDVLLVRSIDDLVEAQATDRIGLLLAFEGAEPLGNDPSLVDLFVELGVRMVGLTHFQRNAFADGNGEPRQGGLSALGRQLVSRLESLGVVLDLAHASDGTFDDTLDAAPDADVIVSHTACRSLHDTQRNIGDDQMRAVAERDGVVGIFPVPMFLGGEDDTSLDRFVDHIEHAASVIGADRVGIAGDFITRLLACNGLADRLPPWIALDREQMALYVDGLDSARGYPAVADALEARGMTPAEVLGILGGNFLRVLERSLARHSGTSAPGAVVR